MVTINFKFCPEQLIVSVQLHCWHFTWGRNLWNYSICKICVSTAIVGQPNAVSNDIAVCDRRQVKTTRASLFSGTSLLCLSTLYVLIISAWYYMGQWFNVFLGPSTQLVSPVVYWQQGKTAVITSHRWQYAIIRVNSSNGDNLSVVGCGLSSRNRLNFNTFAWLIMLTN